MIPRLGARSGTGRAVILHGVAARFAAFGCTQGLRRCAVRIQDSNRRSILGVPKNAPAFDFPQDLLDAQAALTTVTAERDAYAQSLPWSVEPMPGWTADKQLHTTYRSEKPDSPGYTPEQVERLAGLRARILELTTVVVTHPYWGTLDGPDRVTARTAVKHAHEPAAGA